MPAFQSISIRKAVMDLIKDKFGGLEIWNQIETDITLLCVDLVEPDTQATKAKFTEQIQNIKQMLINNQISQEDLLFLDEELERLCKYNIISLYRESDDSVNKAVIKGFCNIGDQTEGIVGIPQKYNYKQLSKITNAVYSQTNLIKFYISAEHVMYGKISAEISETSIDIPIATLLHSKRKDEMGDPIEKRIALFGSVLNRKQNEIIREITLPFYIYKFTSSENKEFYLMCTEKQIIGDYKITGVLTPCEDMRYLTQSIRLPSKVLYLFVRDVQNRISQFNDIKEYSRRRDGLKITADKFFDFPFAIRSKGSELVKLKHPEWFKWFTWSWLLHEKKGLDDQYPFHIMMIGPPGTGKTKLLDALYANSNETLPVFSGSSSTLKSLIPSFFSTIPKAGYLAEANRFAYCDEFLRCMHRSGSKDSETGNDSIAMMNDLLEHKKRRVGSGISNATVNMTSRMLATSNPPYGINCFSDILARYDNSWVSRSVWYWQTKEHIDMVTNSKDSELEPYTHRMAVNDWIAFVDYLQAFSSVYDLKKVEEVYESLRGNLSENINNHYRARQSHHLECIMDGIVKTRCFLTGDNSFTANEEDYKVLKNVWLHIVRSWIGRADIKDIPVKERIALVSENAQNIFQEICDYKKPIRYNELKIIASESMNLKELETVMIVLKDNNLIVSEGAYFKPHYMKGGFPTQ